MPDQSEVNRLAVDGGQPAISASLPPMYPGGMRIDEEEEAAVLEVLRARRLFRYYGPNEGPSRVAELEQAFAADVGTARGLALTSGTAALDQRPGWAGDWPRRRGHHTGLHLDCLGFGGGGGGGSAGSGRGG